MPPSVPGADVGGRERAGLGHGRLLDPVAGGNIARIGGFVPGLHPDEPGLDPAH